MRQGCMSDMLFGLVASKVKGGFPVRNHNYRLSQYIKEKLLGYIPTI